MTTPEERSLNARIAANTRVAMCDGRDMTQPARDKAFERFEREVDPTNSLPPEERIRRATALRKAHLQRIAKLSHASRRRNKEAKQQKQQRGTTNTTNTND